MLALAFLLAVDAMVAFTLVAEGAIKVARNILRHEQPYTLPPHEDPNTITRYRDDVLDPLRTVGDKLTDDLIETIAGSGAQPGAGPAPGAMQTVRLFYKTLKHKRLLDLADFVGEAYAADLRNWVDDVGEPPVDYLEQLKRAGEFFTKNFAKIMVILSTDSLLQAFACAKGVRVLASTDYFSKDPNRRLYETLQFVMYVNEPDGFQAKGNAMNAIRRIRLMHGCIRWILLHEPAVAWDEEVWGKPINGEDLLGMQMGFSGLVIRDLPKVWADVTYQNAEDQIFLWNVVGQLLGLPMEHRAESLGEALALIDAIQRRQQAPSDDGKKMAAALVRFHKQQLGTLFPVGLFLMHRLAGEHICKMLDVPWSPIQSAIIPDTLIDDVLTTWGAQIIVLGAQGHDQFDIPAGVHSVIDELMKKA